MIKITQNYLMKHFISFDEMGAFDLPAALTYVRSKTRSKKKRATVEEVQSTTHRPPLEEETFECAVTMCIGAGGGAGGVRPAEDR